MVETPPIPSAVTHAGPDELLRLKKKYLVPCAYHFYKTPPQIVAGEGCYLIDHEGRRYLDCFSGVTVMSAGHSQPEILEPVIQQLTTLQHTTSIYLTEPVLRLAEKLASIAPAGLSRSFFCASGTEAVEGALMLAAIHTKKPDIIAATGALHGRTRWAINATGVPLWKCDPFPQPGVHRCPYGNTEAVALLLKHHANSIGALIIEPIQGNGGIQIPPPEYLPRLRELCTKHNVLLIADEVQTAFNRTGSFFACQSCGVTPDVIAISKSLGNGFPIAGYITTDAIAASFTQPSASTYGGNPMAATAALATIAFHQKHKLGTSALRLGKKLLTFLVEQAAAKSHLKDPRGKGLMIGIDIVDPHGEPDPVRLDLILESLKDAGFLVGKSGIGRNTLTLLPPLIITDTQLEDLCDALEHHL